MSLPILHEDYFVTGFFADILLFRFSKPDGQSVSCAVVEYF
jgi:hypothetical protein